MKIVMAVARFMCFFMAGGCIGAKMYVVSMGLLLLGFLYILVELIIEELDTK